MRSASSLGARAGCAPDLSSTRMGLMCREPARRWSGRDVLSRLGCGPVAVLASEVAGKPLTDAPFVGRTRELEVLGEAYLTVARGCAAAVYVCGPSGIGKSALVRSFLGRLTTRDDVVVLSGRCYEHESVPYKALDGVVDSLSRYMVSLSQLTAESLLPHEVVALPRLFPVMLRVPAIASACREREPPISEPFLLRRLAFEVVARASRPYCRSPATGHLHRRPAVGGPRRGAVARGVAAAAGCSGSAHRGVVPE